MQGITLFFGVLLLSSCLAQTLCNTTGSTATWNTDCTLPAGDYLFTSVFINATVTIGSSITSYDPPDGHGVTIRASSAVTIFAHGKIDGVGQGFYGTGPGYYQNPYDNYATVSSGGHAGNGFNGQQKRYYGDFRAPIALGSGGGTSPFITAPAYGGGAVHIVTPIFNSVGIINMDGAPHTENAKTGGSGGSIFIECTALLSLGTVSVNGPYLASGGRIAVISQNGSADVFANVVVPSSGSGSPATVYVKNSTAEEIYALGHTYTDVGGYRVEKLYIYDYGATVFSNSSETFRFSRIHVDASARLIFSNPNDTLQLDGTTTQITGGGPILVAGILDSKNQAIGNSSCPIGVLETGTALVDTLLAVHNSDFMSLGHLVSNTHELISIDAKSTNASHKVAIFLGGKGSNQGNNSAGNYLFNTIVLANASIIFSSNLDLNTGVFVTASSLMMTGTSTVSASGQGFPCGKGPGVGVPSFDYIPAGGGSHGGRGVTLNKAPKFTALHANAPTDYANFLVKLYNNQTGAYGNSYGDFTSPLTLGSGGGLPQSFNPYDFTDNPHELELYGSGGGALKLLIDNITMQDSSTISADGTASSEIFYGMAGDGAGGSIFVEGTSLSISAGSKISAAGGSSYTTRPPMAGGGRISINVTFFARYGDVEAPGSSPGTVYYNSAAPTLILNNLYSPVMTPDARGSLDYATTVNLTGITVSSIFVGGLASVIFEPQLGASTLSLVSGDNTGIIHLLEPMDLRPFSDVGWSVGFALHAQQTGTILPQTLSLAQKFLLIDCAFSGLTTLNLSGTAEVHFGPTATNIAVSTVQLSSVHLADTSTLRLRPSKNGTPDSSILYLSIDFLQIDTQASLNADGMGYSIGQGPLSGPLQSLNAGVGGGHAGRVPGADNSNLLWGYGEVRVPNTAGSGACPGPNDATGPGAGGGVVHLTINVQMELYGQISANGQGVGYDFAGHYTNLLSGAGGSVFISAANISGNGTISADGFGGAASGGHVAVFAPPPFSVGPIKLTANAHSTGGSCGTVYLGTNFTDPNSTGKREELRIVNTANARYPTVVGSLTLLYPFTLELTNSPPFLIASAISINLTQINFLGPNYYAASVYVAGVFTGFDTTLFGKLLVFSTGTVRLKLPYLTAGPNFTFDIDGAISALDTIQINEGYTALLGPFAAISGSNAFRVNTITIDGTLHLYGNDLVMRCVTLNVGTITISQTGVLSTTGFSEGLGPAPFKLFQTYASHASYSCNSAEYPSTSQNNAIGDFLMPTLMGSGGPPPVVNLSSSTVVSSVSGGNIWIVASNVSNFGAMSVDGQFGAAAGSILIQTKSYQGTGILSAFSTFMNSLGTTCNADGRIALYYNTTGPGPNFYQTVLAGSYYEKNVTSGTSLVYLQQRANSQPPALIPPVSLPLPAIPSVTTIYFMGRDSVLQTPLQAINVTSFNGSVLSSLISNSSLTLQTNSVVCGLVPNYNCNLVNYFQLTIVPEATNGSGVRVAGYFYNYGFIIGQSVYVTGQFFMRIAYDTDPLFANGTAFGFVPGAVLVKDFAVAAGGQLVFDMSLSDNFPVPQKRFYYTVAPRAYLHALNSITLDGGIITADGTGGQLDIYNFDCFGGGSYGPGGGGAFGSIAVYDNDASPTEIGLGPSNCSGSILSDRNFGGGAVHIVTQHLYMKGGARIVASGVQGGGGGAVWIQAPHISVEIGSRLVASGAPSSGIAVCGSGGRIAVQSLSNLTAGTNLTIDVSGATCPYAYQPSDGNFVSQASPYYFIAQTLVFYMFPTSLGSFDFIRFGMVGLKQGGATIESYYMPDNYEYYVISNNAVIMESSRATLGSVQIYVQQIAADLMVTTTFFYDWYYSNPNVDSLDFSFRLLDPADIPLYTPMLSSSSDGYFFYSWNNNHGEATGKFTLLSDKITVDGVALPSNISMDSFLHVSFPYFFVNVSFTFTVRSVVLPTKGPTIAPTTSPNPCLKQNGGCDPRVTCTFSGSGHQVCGSCPEGTTGSGDTLCTLLCGDKQCNATIGEDCVSCPVDCNATITCGACGDGACDSHEGCSLCPSDCGPCIKPKPCDKNCNHGKCANGQCTCDGGWSGPFCNFPTAKTQPINSTLNATNPGVQIDSPTAKFAISIKRIAETDGTTEFRAVDITAIKFTKVEVDNGKNTINTYNAALGNGASLNVIVSQFEEESTPYSFAGTKTTYPAHTIKININVTNWPFLTLANSLVVIFDAKNENSASKSTTCTNDDNNTGNLQWLLLVVDQTSLYVQFLDTALVDGRVRKISFSFNSSDETVAAILPHFWDYSEMDPSYNVLLGDVSPDEACTGLKTKTKNVSKKVIIAVVVPIVVLILLAVLFIIFALPRLNTWRKVRHTRVPSHNQDTELDNVPQIEHTKEYSVNTAAGNFRVEL